MGPYLFRLVFELGFYTDRNYRGLTLLRYSDSLGSKLRKKSDESLNRKSSTILCYHLAFCYLVFSGWWEKLLVWLILKRRSWLIIVCSPFFETKNYFWVSTLSNIENLTKSSNFMHFFWYFDKKIKVRVPKSKIGEHTIYLCASTLVFALKRGPYLFSARTR